MGRFPVAPTRGGASLHDVQLRTPRYGQGIVLSNLCLALATVVTFCTYNLGLIANSVVYLGMNEHGFDDHQWNVPVFTLLEATSSLRLSTLVVVCLSKTILGLSILFVTFWDNPNLQTLTTYLVQNKIESTNAALLVYCGPALVASIVGIMTGPFIQLCFTPRIVTQTWLLTLFSLLNFVLVFALEAFVFPTLNKTVPGRCGYSSSTNCLHLTAIPQTYYLSAVVAGGVVVAAVGTIHLHARWLPETVFVPPSHSVLQYLNIQKLRQTATSGRGCVARTLDGDIVIDHGVLGMKKMLRVSSSHLTRIDNAKYTLLYRLVPAGMRRWVAQMMPTMLVVRLRANEITRHSYYESLRRIDDDSKGVYQMGFTSSRNQSTVTH
ncbi:hypothetical protein SDRG_16413 [Saprolegnia diclina VS20]|uniref:Uncharacterized protein n=1 Tax=Saprolegnia diclina (strain VS20) TaxID=1156394 RepID=T0R8D2_SAPDV|nr:hypothetical protein SDRG_16413 [Saprolegnia diclina VS20]EQC25752.1 hypothetical protein SDRG_16413 [Saprolegnia diclina VS20]|eukprot:XP_008620844.1 hypothetical protein SDRG_16413 [Saprolegnia diclina VS20]